MRLIYRPLLSYVIWKAILRAVKGALVGKLGSDSDRERNSEQHDPSPIPQHHFAWGIQRVSHGDGGEDRPERSPGGHNLGFGLPNGGRLDQRRRKGIEREGDESAGISAEAAGNVPERCAQEQTARQERKLRKPSPVSCRLSVKMAWPNQEWSSRNKRKQRRVLSVESIFTALG